MGLDLSALTVSFGLRRRNVVSMADALISGILFDKKQVVKVSEYCMPVERESPSIYLSIYLSVYLSAQLQALLTYIYIST